MRLGQVFGKDEDRHGMQEFLAQLRLRRLAPQMAGSRDAWTANAFSRDNCRCTPRSKPRDAIGLVEFM